MQVYTFRGRGRLFGFTGDATGANLPSQYAWNPFKTMEMQRGR